MTESILNVNTVVDSKPISIPITSDLKAEDVCIQICKQLNIGTLARHLFALRVTGKPYFLIPSATFADKIKSVDFRMRFKVANIQKLQRIDAKAYDYYFHQARNDVLENNIPDLVFERYRRELVGLGIADMYRVMLEKDIPQRSIENDYRKYIPKEVVKRHLMFIKRPIRDTLSKLQKSIHDPSYVKAEYIKQLETIAPEYLSETYKAIIDKDGSVYNIVIKVTPFHPEEPGIRYYIESKKEEWIQICTIDELGFVSIRKDGTIEISRKNGIPFYFKFNSIPTMYSFVSVLDGYYRLSCKWTFNICGDVITPSLIKLHGMKCHGPVGGEFSYAKLEEKRSNRPGCFIIRESDSKYNNYYIDVCTKDSLKPKTFKLERLISDEFIFNDDLNKYKSINQLMAAYNDEDAPIYLYECLPPSENDESPLLLCKSENIVGDSLTNTNDMNNLLPSAPVCINWKDLQVYKDRKCLKWNKDRSKVKVNGKIGKQKKFQNINFPDETIKDAKKYCRNPDGDVSGPWCWVEDEETHIVEKEYCDIPFCDDQECEVFTKNQHRFTHYTAFNNTLSNFTFGIKLWDSDVYMNASARLLLSLVALPLTGKEIEDAGIGIEIMISNKHSALTFGNKDEIEFEDTRGILKSAEYTWFELTWHRGFITLNVEGRKTPIFLQEYKTKKNLMGYKQDMFNYYAAQGMHVFFAFPFCIEDYECDVHTTTGMKFQQYWPLKESTLGHDLFFHVRTFHSAWIILVQAPSHVYPNVKIGLSDSDNFTRVLYKESLESSPVLIKELQVPKLLDYWEWRQFSLSVFSNTLQLYTQKPIGMQIVFELQNQIFRKLRWFSVASDNSVAHWSFNCVPPVYSNPPPALLPECALDSEETNYKGTQSITREGLPCLPWSSVKLHQENDVTTWFKNETTLHAWNYCRDPLEQRKGTYCFAVSLNPEIAFKKHFCKLRECKSENCRMAGTGNDYFGKLTTTRSNRTCVDWDIENENSTETKKNTYQKVWNGSLFSDMFVADAKNYCRNPSRDITGQKKEGSRGFTIVYRSMWKLAKGKKIEVALKALKHESTEKYLKEFLTIAGQWAFLQSHAIVRLYGITLTTNISLVLEYFRLGPLDQYLRENKGILKPVDLIEAASNLAAALWHLKENGIVHGQIRCHKLVVFIHDENSFKVKLTDPGIGISYSSKEVHWIPIECYLNLEHAKRSTAADVWALATTLWEIFMFGEEIVPKSHTVATEWYAEGKRLPQPPNCPSELYTVMRECWDRDPHRRKQPQAIVRDVNQILYEVYNSRRTHSYAKIFNKSLQSQISTSTLNSNFNRSESTVEDFMDASEVGSEISGCSSGFSGHDSQAFLLNSEKFGYGSTGSDMINFFSTIDISTATTSLDSLQSIIELGDDCNVVLQGRIGQGFYGEVYKGTLEYVADDNVEPRRVAVKKLKTSAIPSSLQDFEREISIMKTLKHPNIVEILGVIRDPEILLIMEYIEHGSLQNYLKIHREHLQTQQLLKFALDIAMGMAYLGTKNIVHRDLAARNILVVSEDHVKISDFGLAQVMGTNDYYILKTNRELPIKWYAPESLRDGKFSVRSDVWSFGVTMCEMFNAGEEPNFVNIKNELGQEQRLLLNALEQGERFPAPQMCPQSIYICIIRSCWEANPKDRPLFSQLVKDIEKFLEEKWLD